MSRLPELEQQLVAAAGVRAARRGARPWGLRSRPRARVLMPFGAAVAAALVATVLLVGGGGRSVETAAAALRDAAAVARSQPPVPLPGPGEYLYSKVTNVPSLAFGPEPPFQREIHTEADYGFSAQVPNVQEVWQGPDGGRQRIVNGEAVLPTARDRRAWVAAGRPQLPGGDVSEDRLGPLEPLGFPTDPDALYARLEAEAADRGAGRYAYMFAALVGDTLSEGRTTPEQRAALFEVAARIPGVESLGHMRDPEGREGIAFAMRDEQDAYRVTLIVDPETSDLLAKVAVALPGNPIPAGTVTSTQTYDRPVVVDAIGERAPS